MKLRQPVLTMALVVACLMCARIGTGAYLEQDKGAPGRSRSTRPPAPSLPNTLSPVVERVTVLPGRAFKDLTVFPLRTRQVQDETAYLSLAEGLESQKLVLTEKEQGEVRVLLAHNGGSRPVLMLAGEMVTGGKQNRILREDVLLEPGSGPVELPVYCGEKGRWERSRRSFGGAPFVAAFGVRSAALRKAPQAEVWRNIERCRREAGLMAPEGDLQAVQSSETVRRRIEPYAQQVERDWPRRTMGLAVARGSRIVAADIFCNPAVFSKHRRRLLESYAMRCLQAGPRADRHRREGGISSRQMVEIFLRGVVGGSLHRRAAAGGGFLLEAAGPHGRGTALCRREALLHAFLLPRGTPIPRPLAHPMPERSRPK